MADKETQKKQIGEFLKSADKSIKNAQWTKALEEVNKALAIEPNNMYAMAYKDRINVSIENEKKKAEEEKIKKLAEDKKNSEKSADQVKESSPEAVTPEEKPQKAPSTEAVTPEEKGKKEPSWKGKA